MLTASGYQTGHYALGVTLYYPTQMHDGARAVYLHSAARPQGKIYAISETGLAQTDAPVAPDRLFPLVVVSHGYGGWATHFSRVLELVASHGYIVAAIDHDDLPHDDVPAFLASFGNVLVERSADQRATIKGLQALARAHQGVLAAVDAAAPIGLIGYSMGGYGATATAGATYDPAAHPLAGLPQAARDALARPDPAAAATIGALVLIAPWGAQPDNRMWTAAAVGTITAPTLLIDGDQDDVVNYRAGVRWLFDQMAGTDRHLLTFHGARHNLAGNAVTLAPDAPEDVIGWFTDPVWRQDRLNQLHAHFITAFLDGALRHDAAHRALLDVPTVESDAGIWPVGFGEQTGARRSGAGEPGYWRGFARGTAAGMALEHKEAGK
jgi:predicted dienelactone hydrolase